MPVMNKTLRAAVDDRLIAFNPAGESGHSCSLAALAGSLACPYCSSCGGLMTDDSAQAFHDFGILGPLTVTRRGRHVDLGGPKLRTLLAIFLVHANEVVTRDRVIDDLWEGRPPPSAANLVQVYVSKLRRILEPEREATREWQVLVTRASGYVLRADPGQIDASRFASLLDSARGAGDDGTVEALLREAKSLWRGSPFADFTDTRFARAEIVRLNELRLECAEERIEAELGLGHHHIVIPELEALIAENPLRERPRSQLMMALARSGRQVEALDIYRAAWKILANDLGIEPSPELQRLELAVLLQEPSATWTPPPQAIAGSARRSDSVLVVFVDLAANNAVSLHKIAAAVDEFGGEVLQRDGRDLQIAFPPAGDAGQSCMAVLSRVESLGLPVAVHAGVGRRSEAGFEGEVVRRGECLLAVANQGQVLVSGSAQHALKSGLPPGASLHHLGTYRLADLGARERIFQLDATDCDNTFPPLRSLDEMHHNLPIEVDSFVGRGDDLAELSHRLTSNRLLTLVGPGGCGKTRLARHLAAHNAAAFVDGVLLVDLVDVRDGESLIQAVAEVLGVLDQFHPALEAAVATYLKRRMLLLVLDNCEHLIDAVRRLTAELLRSCAGLKILITSREPLDTAGELHWRVSPLTAPAAGESHEFGDIERFAAVELFVDRAKNMANEFAVTGETSDAISRICRHVDGVPLAIELSSAQLGVLTVHEVAASVEDRLWLLDSSSEAGPPQHHNMRAVLDWSHETLTLNEQALLRRVSVFAGGFTADAARRVCADAELPEAGVLESLAGLVTKSLVLADIEGREPRYRLFETVREYGRERLGEAGEQESLENRHRDWATAAATPGPMLLGATQSESFDRIQADYDNLIAALRHSAGRDDGGAMLQLVGEMWFFWYVRGRMREGRKWLETALGLSDDDPALRVQPLFGLGILALNLGDHEAAKAAGHESLELCDEFGDEAGIAMGLNLLGLVARYEADFAEAARLHQEALAIAARVGHQGLRALSLCYLGLVEYYAGDAVKASELVEQALVGSREFDDAWMVSLTTAFLGQGALARQDISRAEAHFEESLLLCHQLQDLSIATLCLEGLARVAIARDRPQRAAAFLHESLQIHERQGAIWLIAQCAEQVAELAAAMQMGRHAVRLISATAKHRNTATTPRSEADKTGVEATMAAATHDFGPGALADAVAAGAAMTPAQTISLCLEVTEAISLRTRRDTRTAADVRRH